MPKNSRPDIQVLEDRIVRLKAQLHEYEDLRLYSVTKRRLSAVSDELSECISIIRSIVDTDTNNISSSSMSAFVDYPGGTTAEFGSDGDLLDTFLLNSTAGELENAGPQHSAKEIVRTYSDNIKKCADNVGYASGVLQVNQFCVILNSWYQTRFAAENRNPNFYFKASRIHEWIDLLILAAGHALHEGLFLAFTSDFTTWIESLNTPKDEGWVLPYSVMRMQKVDASCCTREAVLLELMIKPILYNSTFYPKKMHSVAQIVIENSEFTSDDLKIDQIIQNCPKLVVTSSFDISKYQEE